MRFLNWQGRGQRPTMAVTRRYWSGAEPALRAARETREIGMEQEIVDARHLANNLAPGCAVWPSAFSATGRDTVRRRVTDSWTCRTFAGLGCGLLGAVPNNATGVGRLEVNENSQLTLNYVSSIQRVGGSSPSGRAIHPQACSQTSSRGRTYGSGRTGPCESARVWFHQPLALKRLSHDSWLT